MNYPLFFPDEKDTYLLRLALSSLCKNNIEKDFQKYECNFAGYTKNNYTIKRLLPLLAFAQKNENVMQNQENSAIFSAASLWETTRYQHYIPVLKMVVEFLQNQQVKFTLLKGLALAHTVYPQPFLRHTHDIDILVKAEDFENIGDLIRNQLPFYKNKNILNTSESLFFIHQTTNFPLRIHKSLFSINYYHIQEKTIQQETTYLSWQGYRLRLLNPEIQLLHVIIHSSYNFERQWSSFIPDSFYIIQHFQDLNWQKLLEMTLETKAIIPMYSTLLFLQKELSANIPQSFLDELRKNYEQIDCTSKSVASFFEQQKITGYCKSFFFSYSTILSKEVFHLFFPTMLLAKRYYRNSKKPLVLLYISYLFLYTVHLTLFLFKRSYLLTKSPFNEK